MADPQTPDPNSFSNAATSADAGLPPRLLAKLKLEVEGYELLDRLGAGGQATVYRARRLIDDTIVAIKILHAGPHASENARARLKREINALLALNHPNIVRAIAAGRTRSGLDCLVMNYIDGRPLDALWQDDGFASSVAPGPADRLRLFKQICEIVQVAHLKGITHRDLSPSNILIDRKGRPYVLDFGTASTAFDDILGPGRREISVTGQFIGKIQYASPEQASGTRHSADIRTDVYALGVMLYQLLTKGAFPYEVVGNVVDVLNNIIHREPTPPSQRVPGERTRTRVEETHQPAPSQSGVVRQNPPLVNEVIEAVVLKALEKDPKRRYQSAGELASDIDRYLAGQPTSAVIWSLRAPAVHTSVARRTSRKFLAGAAAVSILLLSGVIMNAKTIAIWLGLTATATAPVLVTQPVNAAMSSEVQAEPETYTGAKRLNKLAEDLSLVEARRLAIVRQLELIGARQADFDTKSGIAGPISADAFCSRLDALSTESGRDLSIKALATEERERVQKAESESIARETDKGVLLARQHDLEMQQASLWSQLICCAFGDRDPDRIFRFRAKSDGSIGDISMAQSRAFDGGVIARRTIDAAFREQLDVLSGLGAPGGTARSNEGNSLRDLAERDRNSLIVFRQRLLDAKELPGAAGDAGATIDDLLSVSKLLLDSLEGAAESQAKLTGEADEQSRLVQRARLQTDVVDSFAAAVRLDNQIVALSKAWKIEIDPASKLSPLALPPKKPTTPTNDATNSVTQEFTVGSVWEVDGGGTASVQSASGNVVVIGIKAGDAPVRILQLEQRGGELWLISDSRIPSGGDKPVYAVKGRVVQGKLTLAGTRTVLVAGKPTVENVTYILTRVVKTPTLAVAGDPLAAWKVGSRWINFAPTDAKDKMWEVTSRSGHRIEISRGANKQARDLIVSFDVQPDGTAVVSNVAYSDGDPTRGIKGKGTLTANSLSLSYEWENKRDKRKGWWHGTETIQLKPQ